MAISKLPPLARSRKPRRPAPRKKAKPAPTPPPDLLRTRWSPPQLLRHFRQLLPVPLLAGWLALGPRTFYHRAFTPLVTLWYCIFQRLSPNHHLSQVQQDALAGGADHLSPRGKPLSQQVHSEATTSFSDARQRLPREVFRKTLRHTAAQMSGAFQIPERFGLKVALMDGTTCRLRPFQDIPQEFPPHRPGNCKKQPYWCLARIVGLFCLATGAVLDSAMGSLKTSEQTLSATLLQRSWEKWLLVADRNFGVYSVVCAAVAAQAHVLVRLTQARAAKLARLAGLSLAPGLDAPLRWSPSRQDQCPEGLPGLPVAGRLLVVRLERPGYRPLTLYLFTTLQDPLKCSAQELAQLYGQRWQVELCFRYVKTQMDLGFLECHSADMVHKEWLAGLIAYNLIRWAMAAAAAAAQVPQRWLSFSRARELLLGWCLRTSGRGGVIASWQRLLTRIAKAQLPKRRKIRPSEPRAVRHFQKDVAKLEGSRAAARLKLAESNANS
jgi:Transposase DDE domain